MVQYCLNKKGFSLVEMITTLVLAGVLVGIFYAVFFMNWQAFEQYIARADFHQDLDTIVDGVASDGRFSRRIDVVLPSPDLKQAVFIFPPDNNGAPIAPVTYSMRDNGRFTVTRGAAETVITDKLDFPNSSFVKINGGNSLLMNLSLTDNILGHTIDLNSMVEIHPRNSNI